MKEKSMKEKPIKENIDKDVFKKAREEISRQIGLYILKINYCKNESGDRRAIYVGKSLKYQGDSIPDHIWIKVMSDVSLIMFEGAFQDYSVRSYTISDRYFNDFDEFPELFSDIPDEYF